MAENGNVVDELVVKLVLDAKGYERAGKEVDGLITKTEKKRKTEDQQRKKREQDQVKRMKETTRLTKGWALAVRGLGSVAGVASLALTAAVASMTKFAGFETNLRRFGVSTNLSNRELQAWGSTARRLGADAQSGAAAIASLAREQQQFNMTGQGPTMQALARMGVNVGPGVALPDMLEQAQRMYRQSSPAQQSQIEAGLAAQGVSSDLIVMIKSETDAREAFNKSLQESATENRTAINAINGALASLANSAVSVGNSLATIAQGPVKEFADWVSKGVQNLSTWNDQIIAAGGGLQGLDAVLTQEFPNSMRVVTDGLKVLGQAVDVLAYGMQQAWGALKSAFSWLSHNKTVRGVAHDVVATADKVGGWIAGKWHDVVGYAESHGPAPVAHLLAGSAPKPALGNLRGVSNAQAIMGKLITQYGLNVDQAAAIAASMGAESSFNPAAFNPAGGGQGARGLAQWRGARIDAFRAKYGIMPDAATVDQQLAFMFSDPYERGLLKQALSGPGGAAALGAQFSRVFEADGSAASDAVRARTAMQYAAAYNGPSASTPGALAAPINITGPVTVMANNPVEFVGGIQRLAAPQNYNSATR